MSPPTEVGTFEFVVVAGLRAKQLALGCVPRVGGSRPHTVLARLEVAEGKVVAVVTTDPRARADT